MNKEKTTEIIENLIDNIEKQAQYPEFDCARLYVKSWVIGGLNSLKSKINGGYNYYPENATYKTLFQDFICYFYCLNINPKIKIYAIGCLFSVYTRDLIIDLYESLFTLKDRDIDAHSCGYVDWNQLDVIAKFDIIRLTRTRFGRC